MDIQTVLAAVDHAFATTGASTPPWPDPHAHDRSPADEEYSRLLDPGKYRVLGARVAAWLLALEGLGLATVEEVTEQHPLEDVLPRSPVDRAVRVRPVRPGGVPLTIGLGSLDGHADASVVLAAGEPTVLVAVLPDCGCDACDSGSEALLDELDEYVSAAVSGAFVHVTTPSGTVLATGRGWSAAGRIGRPRDIEGLLERARQRQSQYPVVMGTAWY